MIVWNLKSVLNVTLRTPGGADRKSPALPTFVPVVMGNPITVFRSINPR